MPPGKAAASVRCRRAAAGRNWYAVPTETVQVDRRRAYKQCCEECAARAEDSGGCKAFSVNIKWVARGVPHGRKGAGARCAGGCTRERKCQGVQARAAPGARNAV